MSADLSTISETARISFIHFFYGIFALGVWKVEGVFEPGKHLDEWNYRLQKFDKTSTVAARYHLKTTVILGYLAWQLYKLEQPYLEWLFIGYTQDLAAHHLKRLKRYIAAIPEYFDDCISLTQAESILHYSKNGQEFVCEPEGIQSFKRGRHPYGIICDDILRDPEVKLDISQLIKIETVFVEQIMQMPKAELHVVGTPQDEADLFARLESMPSFNCKRYPATVANPLWPEVFPKERLLTIKADIRERAFAKEFECRPVRSEEGYFTSGEIDEVIDARYRNYGYRRKAKINGYCYGGLDIGKKRHPSHISIFAENRHRRLIQIVSIWLDAWDYNKQVELCRDLVKDYEIQRFCYDDTRAEFEGFKERGELPPEMKGINFTQKKKFEMAAQFEKGIKNKGIVLLKDERQRRQILNVDNDLKSMETNEGHGDSFWSNALALDAAKCSMAEITIL